MVLELYKLTRNFPPEERFALTQQLRRAVLSVHLNVAEGCSRKSESERKRFFEIARGSIVEIDTGIDIAMELNYCNPEMSANLGSAIISSFKQLSALINKHSPNTHH
jgi:four helix bundle protein